jgi:DNA primase
MTVAVQVTARLEQTEIQALVEAIERAGQIPRDIDKQLLGGARAAIGRDLGPVEKKDVRRHFVEECRRRLT